MNQIVVEPTPEQPDKATLATVLSRGRVLMSASLLFAVSLFGVVKLSTDLTVYGVKFEVLKPEIIVGAFWLIWAYVFVWYCQFHYIRRAEIQKEFMTFYFPNMARAVGKKLVKRYIKEEVENVRKRGDDEFDHDFLLRRVRVVSFLNEDWDVRLDISVAFKTATGVGARGPRDLHKWLSGQELLIPNISAWSQVIFLTPYALEYWMPYIVVTIPVWVFLSDFL